MAGIGTTDRRPSVAATEKSLRIVETVRERGGATLTEVADEMDVAKSTVYNHLRTLEDHDYVVREDNEYHVGYKFVHHGEYVRFRKRAYRLAAGKLSELGERTSEETDFSVPSGGRLITLAQDHVHHNSTVASDRMPGSYYWLHNTAAGKAILATYSRDRVGSIVDDWGLPATTENTITSKEALFEELERIQQQGFAMNDEESTKGLRCVSVAASDPSGNVVGAFSVSGPVYRMQDETFREEIPAVLREITRNYEADLEKGSQ